MNLRTRARKNAFRISYQKIFIGNYNVFQEMEICKWINNLRRNKKIVNSKSVILKARELNPAFGNKSISSKVS